MKVLVTGGAGFIGSHIVELLVSQVYRVVVLDNLSTGSKTNLVSGVPFYQVDITSDELDQVFAAERPEFVIHHAAQVSVNASLQQPVLDGNINILGTINLLECCDRHSVRKVVYASSAAVYGDPTYLPVDEEHVIKPLSAYGISKHTVEHYLELYHRLKGLDYVALRYANVYGPRQDPRLEGGVVAIFCDSMASSKPIEIYGDGKQTRDFIYVKDVARANLLAMEGKHTGIYNVSRGKQISLLELFNIIKELTSYSLEPKFAPARKGDIRFSCLSPNKLQNSFQYVLDTALAYGLEETLQYRG